MDESRVFMMSTLEERRVARLGAVARRPRWTVLAACHGEPVEVFFSSSNNRARELCDRCVVRPECLRYALADPELRGWWAGTSEGERRRLRRRMRAEEAENAAS